MKPWVDQLRREQNHRLVVVEVNLDRESQQNFGRILAVESVPTFVYVSSSGEVLARREGIVALKEMVAMFEASTHAATTNTPQQPRPASRAPRQHVNPLRSGGGAAPLLNVLQAPVEQLTHIQLSVRRGSRGATQVKFEKRSGDWWLTSPLIYPANPKALEAILGVIGGIEVFDTSSGTERDHWVGDAHGLEIKAWGGKHLLSHFVVGRSKGDATFVRAGGKAQIFIARGRCRHHLDKTLDELRDPTITGFSLDQIERVRYENVDGVFELEAVPGDALLFRPVGGGFKQFYHARALQQLRALSQLRARGFIDEPSGADKFADGAARVTVFLHGLEGPKNFELWVGEKTSDGRSMHVRTSEQEQVFLVPAHLLSVLSPKPIHFEKTIELEVQSQRHLPEQRGEKELSQEHAHQHEAAEAATKLSPEAMKALRALAHAQ